MTPAFIFSVHGMPITQGSKRAIPLKNGRIALVEQTGDRLKDWRHAINDEGRRARGDKPMLVGPVHVTIEFALPKPNAAPKKKRTWPIGKRSGDLDKLARAALDALTNVLFADDAQVVELYVRKDYGDPGACIVVRAVEED